MGWTSIRFDKTMATSSMPSTSGGAQHHNGQNHDRLGNDDAPVDITAWQKMLSATSGSLFTGLLGAFFLSTRRALRRGGMAMTI